jgi:SUMO ligase MMS21 Smc5/6 complex component
MDNFSPEQISAMINMLQHMLETQSSQSSQKNSDTHSIKPEKKIKKRTSKNSSFVNKFVDMPEKNMHKEDIEIDKKLKIQPPVPRTRKFIAVDVTCRVCGKKEKVSPALLTEGATRYKCNKCCSSAG